MTGDPDYVTVAEAVRRTGYSRWHIAYLVRTGRIRGVKPGHDWFVHLPSLQRHRQVTRRGRKPTRG